MKKSMNCKWIFEMLSIILIICCVDQLYMMRHYKNISMETFVMTVFFTVLNIYFGFFEKKVL